MFSFELLIFVWHVSVFFCFICWFKSTPTAPFLCNNSFISFLRSSQKKSVILGAPPRKRFSNILLRNNLRKIEMRFKAYWFHQLGGSAHI